MIRVLVRVVVILVGIIATGVAALLVALQLGWARRHDAPEPPLRAVSDSAEPQPHRLTFLGRLLLGVVVTPSGPSRPLLEMSPAGATVARGAYLANDVASCVSCHTDRQRGELVGPRFAGGQRMDFAGDTRRVLVPPNLTPDPVTGRIASWSEGTFVARFRNGASIPETIMPWGAYSRMTDDDLRAVFRYVRSLPPVHRDTGPSLQTREDGVHPRP